MSFCSLGVIVKQLVGSHTVVHTLLVVHGSLLGSIIYPYTQLLLEYLEPMQIFQAKNWTVSVMLLSLLLPVRL